MTQFRVVPDALREREPVRRGRALTNPLAIALLAGKTVFITEDRKAWGNLYKLASNHGKRARTKRTTVNGETGTLAWFEDIKLDSD